MPLSTSNRRILILCYNIIFAISGLTVFILSCCIIRNLLPYNELIDIEDYGPTITLIVIGLFSCVLSWIGWKGAWKSNRILMIIFGILLLGVAVTEIACWIWSIAIWDNLYDEVVISTEKDFSLATINNSQSSVQRWEKIQSQLSCCGIGGPSDYRLTKAVPWSCCTGSTNNTDPALADCGTIYQRGCLTPIYSETRGYILHAGAIGLAAGILQVMGLLLTIYFILALYPTRGDSSEVTSTPETPSGTDLPETFVQLLDRPRSSLPSKY